MKLYKYYKNRPSGFRKHIIVGERGTLGGYVTGWSFCLFGFYVDYYRNHPGLDAPMEGISYRPSIRFGSRHWVFA